MSTSRAFLMFYQFALSPQVKRCSIVTDKDGKTYFVTSDKHGIYELSHELPNNLSFRI